MRQTGQAAEKIREFSHAVYSSWRDALRGVQAKALLGKRDSALAAHFKDLLKILPAPVL